MIPKKGDAISALVGGQITVNSDGSNPVYHDGQTPPTEAEIDTKFKELMDDWDAQEYARNRASSYPSTGDQLDMLMKDMKNGTTIHQEACEAVKAKYPKP